MYLFLIRRVGSLDLCVEREAESRSVMAPSKQVPREIPFSTRSYVTSKDPAPAPVTRIDHRPLRNKQLGVRTCSPSFEDSQK